MDNGHMFSLPYIPPFSRIYYELGRVYNWNMEYTIDIERAAQAIIEFKDGFKNATSYYEIYMNVLDFFQEGIEADYCASHPDPRIMNAYNELQNRREIFDMRANYYNGDVFKMVDNVDMTIRTVPGVKEVTITFAIDNQEWVIGLKDNRPLSNINGTNLLD